MDVPEVNNSLLRELEVMGFSLARAIRAVDSTGNTNLADAVNWAIDHENDADIAELPPVSMEIEIEAPESSSFAEDIKLRAQELRNQALEKEENKMEREMEKTQTRRKLRMPVDKISTIKPPRPIQHENTASLPRKYSNVSERMKECLRSLKRNHKDDDAKVTRAFQTLLIYVGNILKHPNEEKFRKIRLTNPSFQNRVGSLKGGVEFLKLCGFERVEDGGGFLILHKDKVDIAILSSAGSELQSAIANPFFGILSY